MEGGSHYGTSDGGAALSGGGGGGGAGGEQSSVLRIRIRCNPKAADHKPREIVSADSEASRRASDEGLGVHESACGGGGDEEVLANDPDTTFGSVLNRRAYEEAGSVMPKAENATADRVANVGPGGGSKRKHASKGPEIPTCPECGKTFRSDKSLFGHLRCHPEREYRGVNPPANARKSLQSSAPPRVEKWPPAKEAPKAATATAATNDDDEDPESTAAFILIHLSDAQHWDDPKTAASADQEEPAADTKQVVRIYCDRIDSLGWSKTNNAGDDPTSSSCKKTKKRKLKELELVNDSNSSSSYGGSSRRSYQCSICLKAFSSHQALGGHIASHNKQRCNLKEVTVAAMTAGENEGAKLLSKQHGQELPHTSTAEVIKVVTSEHRCTSCNQTFQSGQALGGHKRRHFNELHQAPSSSSAENRSAPSTSPLESSESEKLGGANAELLHSSESDKGQNRCPFKFDLNEVPEN